MLLFLQVLTLFLVAVAMSMALAHALEFPGKRRLDERTYVAVQTIYYPGFTLGGIGEVLAVIATLILLLVMRNGGAPFWWIFAAFIAILSMHAVFWFITQPANRYWTKNIRLGKAGGKFFAAEQPGEHSTEDKHQDWRQVRDQWEYSHIARAVLSTIALIALAVAIAS